MICAKFHLILATLQVKVTLMFRDRDHQDQKGIDKMRHLADLAEKHSIGTIDGSTRWEGKHRMSFFLRSTTKKT